MGLFGPPPEVDERLLAKLHKDSRSGRKLIARHEDALANDLYDGETILAMAVSGPADTLVVVSDKRVLTFKGGRKRESVPAERISRTKVGRNYHGSTQITLVGPSVLLSFPSGDEASYVAAAINSLTEQRDLSPVKTHLDVEWFYGYIQGILKESRVDLDDGQNVEGLTVRISRVIAQIARDLMEANNALWAWRQFLKNAVRDDATPWRDVSVIAGWDSRAVPVVEQRLMKYRGMLVSAGRNAGNFHTDDPANSNSADDPR